MKKIIGTVITLAIGSTVYTLNQADVVNNFSKDTGLTQQEAEQYVNNIKEEDLASFNDIGLELVSDGQELVKAADDTDCINYEYEWESPTLTCEEGKSQLKRLGNSEIALGKSYKSLETDDAGEDDISLAIRNIDNLNNDLSLDIVTLMLNQPTIDDMRKANSYNKALLQAALDSE